MIAVTTDVTIGTPVPTPMPTPTGTAIWDNVKRPDARPMFAAAGVPARGTLFLALAGKEELAANWMHHEMGEFWDELVSSMPGTLNDALQDKFNEVRPRWAVGTSKLVARLVSEHIDDMACRDLSLALGR